MNTTTIKVIFTFSLLINFLLIGFIIGSGSSCGKASWSKPGFAKIEKSDIPSERKQLILDTLKSLKEDKKSNFEKMRAFRQDMKQIMIAETFDTQQYQKKLSEIKSLRDSMFNSMTGKISDLAAKLSQEERQLLAETIEKKFQKYRR